MGDKKQGPKLKITPRKHKQPGFICNLCKLQIGSIEAYKKHIVECLESREYCQTCGSTFAKHKFLVQHMKRFHSSDTVKSKETPSDMLDVDNDENNDNASERSDWDKEDDVYIGEEQGDTSDRELISMTSKDFEKEKEETKEVDFVSRSSDDTRKVKDIRLGRIYRKRTSPMPVLAPVKGKIATITEQSDAGTEDIEADTVKVNETQSLTELNLFDPDCNFEKGPKVTKAKLLSDGKDKKDRNNNATVKCAQEGTDRQRNKETQMGLEFSVKGDAIVQTISVIKDGEELFSSTSRNAGPRFGDMRCNFEDLFGPGKVNLKDVNLEVQQGCLKVDINKDT